MYVGTAGAQDYFSSHNVCLWSRLGSVSGLLGKCKSIADTMTQKIAWAYLTACYTAPPHPKHQDTHNRQDATPQFHVPFVWNWATTTVTDTH